MPRPYLRTARIPSRLGEGRRGSRRAAPRQQPAASRTPRTRNPPCRDEPSWARHPCTLRSETLPSLVYRPSPIARSSAIRYRRGEGEDSREEGQRFRLQAISDLAGVRAFVGLERVLNGVVGQQPIHALILAQQAILEAHVE